MTVGEVPFDQLRIGDKLLSCAGKRGLIGGLFPEGDVDPTGRTAEYGGHILMLWHGPSWSLTYHSGLEVKYLGRPE